MMGSVSKRARKMLVVAGAALGVVVLAGLGWVAVNAGDSVAPDVSDLVPGLIQVPDANNAYTYFCKAAAALHWPRSVPDLRLSPSEWGDTEVAETLTLNAESLLLLERGLGCPACQPYGGPALEAQEPALWPDLFVLLAQKAAYERRTGQYEAARASTCGLLRLGSLVISHPRSVNEWSVGLLALELGLEQAERLLHETPWGETELADLSRRLEACGPLHQHLKEALKMQFQQMNEVIDEWTLPRRGLLGGYGFHPNRTRATAARFYRRVIQNIARPYGQRRLPLVSPLPNGAVQHFLSALAPNRQGRILEQWFLGDRANPDQYSERECDMQSYLDGLRLVVACRLYEIRHGQLPRALDNLVPELLPEVPRDPYDGAPFRYRREAAMVYSVGEDLADSHASGNHPPDSLRTVRSGEPADANDWPEYPSPTPLLRRDRQQAGDWVYPLMAPHPETPSARE